MALPSIRNLRLRLGGLRDDLVRRAVVATGALVTPHGGINLQRYANELIGYGRGKQAAIGSRPPVVEYVDLPVNTVPSWSVPSIQSAVAAHSVGMFTTGSLLYESMQADDRIQSALNGRIKAVTKCDVTMTPSVNGDKRKAKKVAKQLEELWADILPEQVLEQLLTWTIGAGFCLCEVIWTVREDLWIPSLKVWHPAFIYYDISVRQYVAITESGPIYVMDNDPKWFLYTPYGSYRGWLRGAVRSCSIPWIVRQYALRDWARYSEVHGLPQKKVKYPAQAGSREKAAFFSAVKRLGAETAFALPQQSGPDGQLWDVELLEASDRSWAGFQGLINQCDQNITLAIRGTNLTTSVKGGSLAAAQAHRDEDSDYAQSDAKKFATAARDQLFKLFCAYNYGDANLAPTPTFASEQESDLSADAETMNTVADAVTKLETQKWPIDRKLTADKFGIQLKEGEDVGTPPDPETGDGGGDLGENPEPDAGIPEDDGQTDDTLIGTR